MRYGIKIYFVIILSWMVAPSQAQEIKEVLVKINQAYQDAEILHMEIAYKIIEETELISKPELQKGLIYKNKNYLYNKMGETETIVYDSTQVIVDHAKKIIVVTSRTLNTYPGIPIDQMEEALKKCKRINSLNSNSIKGFELWMNENGHEKISFTYNADTYFINRLELFNKKVTINGSEKKNVKLEMDYTYPKTSFRIISMDTYIQKMNGIFVSTEAYKEYQFIDYTVLTGQNLKR